MKKGRIKGVGGIFMKFNDAEKAKEWYNQKLGFKTNEYGALFEFREGKNPNQKGYLQWSTFSKESNYFEPSEKEFMVNYRVENMEELIDDLRSKGVQILDDIEFYEYGKFVHIMDLEGNKIELWEPIDGPFTDLYEGKTNL